MTDRNRDLEGKVALVTGSGAARNLGYACVPILATAGAKVVLHGRREPELVELTEALKTDGLDVACVVADVADEGQVKQMVEFAVDTFGRLDVLVNTAATTAHPQDLDVMHLSTEAWDQSFAVNARGTMLACKYAIPHMLDVGGGSIINYSSGTASAGDMKYTAYACSKAAIHTLTYYIATQYGPQGIRCNTLAIGLVRTAVNEKTIPEPFATIYRRNHAIGRMGRPNEVSEVVHFLASDDSAFITGQVIPVDGGYYAHQPTTVQMAEAVEAMSKQTVGLG
jgi:NAD(P)-dependent dehydrogenase (short-subunit alcohol dehydrogenase family)